MLTACSRSPYPPRPIPRQNRQRLDRSRRTGFRSVSRRRTPWRCQSCSFGTNQSWLTCNIRFAVYQYNLSQLVLAALYCHATPVLAASVAGVPLIVVAGAVTTVENAVLTADFARTASC